MLAGVEARNRAILDGTPPQVAGLL
jgi:hypothetical protein